MIPQKISLINKVKEYKKANYKDYLGFYYGLLAEVQEHKGNYNKALDYFNKALLCYHETEIISTANKF